MRHSKQLGELNLLDHLPRDGLERRQREQQLSEPPARLVLPVANVVLEIPVNLLAHEPYAVRLVQAFGVCAYGQIVQKTNSMSFVKSGLG